MGAWWLKISVLNYLSLLFARDADISICNLIALGQFVNISIHTKKCIVYTQRLPPKHMGAQCAHMQLDKTRTTCYSINGNISTVTWWKLTNHWALAGSPVVISRWSNYYVRVSKCLEYMSFWSRDCTIDQSQCVYCISRLTCKLYCCRIYTEWILKAT